MDRLYRLAAQRISRKKSESAIDSAHPGAVLAILAVSGKDVYCALRHTGSHLLKQPEWS